MIGRDDVGGRSLVGCLASQCGQLWGQLVCAGPKTTNVSWVGVPCRDGLTRR